MLKIASGLAAVLVIGSLTAMLPGEAEARNKAAIRACGGPARNFNQCLQVCGCMGGKVCYKACGTKDFTKVGGRGKRSVKAGGSEGRGLR